MNLDLVLKVIAGSHVIIASLDVFGFVENLHSEMPLVLGVIK